MRTKKKKSVSLVLLILTAALAFVPAACSRGGAKGESAQGAEDDLSEHYTFSFAMLNWGQMVGTDFNSDDVAQFFQKKFNFDWDVIQTTWTDWEEKPRIWINSMDMPDLVFDNFNYNDYKNWVDQDLVKRFPDGWKQKYPNLAKVFDGTMLGPELEKRIEGVQAVLPNIIYFDYMPTRPKIAGHFSLFFRKDWAKALGFEIKNQYTLQEFTAMVEKFMAEGSSLPGVTQGKTDTWNLDTSRVSSAFLGTQWVYSGAIYKDDFGKYVWGPDDPRVFELLRNMKDAINKGVVSRNFASFKNEEQDGLFYTGQAFGMFTHGWIDYVFRYFNEFQAATGLDPFECIQQAVLTDPNGHWQEIEMLNYWSCLYFNPKMSDAKFARLLSILDCIASSEGQDVIRLGFEGKDYTRDGETITITRPKDENGNFKDVATLYPGAGIFSHVTICQNNFADRSPATPQRYFEPVNTMYATKQKIGVDTGTVRAYNFETFFFDGPNYLKFNIDVGAELVRVAMMDGDLRTNYNNWLKEMHAVVDPVLAELNAAFGK
jgi:putative aldouronate transport system substrate-binding protein